MNGLLNKITWAEVLKHANGNWHQILFDLGPGLRDALEAGSNRHVSCPVHGGTDGFRLFDDYRDTGGGVCNTCGNKPSGELLLSWVNGWGWQETRDHVRGFLGLDSCHNVVPIRRHKPETVATEPPKPDEKARERLRRVWRESVPAWHEDAAPLKKYLERRGVPLSIFPPAIRFHRSLPYFDEETKNPLGSFPTMVSIIVNAEGKAVSLHRTYLTADGDKAPVPSPKKEMSKILPRITSGGAIRLYEPTAVLALAEGIETALAVRLATGLPVWSCVNAGLLEQVVIPPSVKVVLICADRDKPLKDKRWPRGEEAARKLMDRMSNEGRYARTYLPPARQNGEGIDWLDVLNERGKDAFQKVVLPTEEEIAALATKVKSA